jgi:hypothetical protein
MTPLVAVPADGVRDTVAATSGWSRHLSVIRAYYGDDWFAGRSVLALGHGQAIDELVSLGARPVNTPVAFDPDQEWPCGPVDLVLHLGLLPRLDVSHVSLRHACVHASHLVIETAVCDSHDANCCVPFETNPSSPEPPPSLLRSSDGQAAVGPGIYPSPARIERLLSEHGMLFQRLADSRCNGPDLIYDWLAADTGRVTPGRHRLWFARRG